MLDTARITRFGANASILTARHGQVLDLETIAAHAPAVFAAEKHESRSDRYTFIDTRGVIEGLLAEGFQIAEVRQGGSRIEGKRDFTKHMLRLRHVSTAAAAVNGDTVVPEVVLFNSHDGTSSYQMIDGVFRYICTNGLISGELFSMVKVPHKGNVRDRVIEGAFTVIGRAETVLEDARAMAATRLSADEMRVFVKSAAQLRWDGDEAPIDAERLLIPRRPADTGPDLWHVMNRTQENLIRAGQSYVGQRRIGDTGRVQQVNRSVGEVRGIDQTRGLNRALWTLADEMMKLKAA